MLQSRWPLHSAYHTMQHEDADRAGPHHLLHHDEEVEGHLVGPINCP